MNTGKQSAAERRRPLPAGTQIEYMGEYATVIADNGGASLLVECNGFRQEWIWEFEGTTCSVVSMPRDGYAVPFLRWTSIDGAPKDGTRILLYRSGFAEDVCVGWWNSIIKEWTPVNGSVFPDATHWAPLPQRPTE